MQGSWRSFAGVGVNLRTPQAGTKPQTAVISTMTASTAPARR